MKTNVRTKGKNTITNRAGGIAYTISPTEQLVQLVSTNLFKEKKYYGDVQKEMDTAIEKVAQDNPQFILKLASYCRNELYLRTVSIYLLVKASTIVKCKPYVKVYTPKIIRRADEINEALSCYIKLFCKEEDKKHKNKKIPNSLKKGIKLVFPTFNEYQFAKYSRQTNVTFKDAIMLTHPKEPSTIIKQILDDTLPIPETWETIISTKGSTKETWEYVVNNVWLKDNKILNYMALMRNLNNLAKVNVNDKTWNKVIASLQNYNAIINSKQLPFRYYTAYKNFNYESNPFTEKLVKQALNNALQHSIKNCTNLDGRTVVVCDLSGSMDSKMSEKGTTTYKEIASVMGALTMHFAKNNIVYGFADECRLIDNLTNNILSDADKIHNTNIGCSTNAYVVFQDMIKKNLNTDRIILFSDMELWDSINSYFGNEIAVSSIFEEYKKKINPNVKLYLFNLNSYGDATPIQFKDKQVVLASGWSERVLDFISNYEIDSTTFINTINNYNI
jgi:60 kDa SS-A/Ro ribonucleoprotein